MLNNNRPSWRRHALSGTILVASACVQPAFAGSNVLGISLSTQQKPDNFNEQLATVAGISYAHNFENNFIFGASVTYFDVARSSAWHLNSEAGIGYRHAFNDIFSVAAMVSIGSRAQSNDINFPYYAITGSIDWKLMPEVTWSILDLRYRNAFNTDYKFETPAVGSKVTFMVNESNSMYFRYLREWSNGEVADNYVGVGYQYHF